MAVKPQALKSGDTICFLSPSSRLNTVFPDRIDRAKAWFEKHGFRIKIIFSAVPSDTSRLDEMNHICSEMRTAFTDTKIKAIICTIGRTSCNELLEHLDYEAIKRNPKIFVGYSDITILHHALYVRCNLRTFYGPAVIPCFGEYPQPLDFTAQSFMEVLSGTPPAEIPRSAGFSQEFLDWNDPSLHETSRTLMPAPGWTWLRAGQPIKGALFGGCLPSLVQLTGTPYLPSRMYRERILFVETPEYGSPQTPFPLAEARAALTDLRNAGIMHDIVGLVAGRPYMYDDAMRRQFHQLLLDATVDLDFPVLADVDIGHTHPMLTLPLDAMCELDPENDAFRVLEAAVTAN